MSNFGVRKCKCGAYLKKKIAATGTNPFQVEKNANVLAPTVFINKSSRAFDTDFFG
jgi:hypothetical protein